MTAELNQTPQSEQEPTQKWKGNQIWIVGYEIKPDPNLSAESGNPRLATLERREGEIANCELQDVSNNTIEAHGREWEWKRNLEFSNFGVLFPNPLNLVLKEIPHKIPSFLNFYTFIIQSIFYGCILITLYIIPLNSII